MPSISSARLKSLRTSGKAKAAAVRRQTIDLVFTAAHAQFGLPIQRAIEALIPNAADRPAVGLVFSAGRNLTSEPIRNAIVQVLRKPGDIPSIIDLVFIFPETLVGPQDDTLSATMRALIRLGADEDALSLAQDLVLIGGKATRIFATAAVNEDPASLIPALMGLVATAWPEIEGDIKELQR